MGWHHQVKSEAAPGSKPGKGRNVGVNIWWELPRGIHKKTRKLMKRFSRRDCTAHEEEIRGLLAAGRESAFIGKVEEGEVRTYGVCPEDEHELDEYLYASRFMYRFSDCEWEAQEKGKGWKPCKRQLRKRECKRLKDDRRGSKHDEL